MFLGQVWVRDHVALYLYIYTPETIHFNVTIIGSSVDRNVEMVEISCTHAQRGFQSAQRAVCSHTEIKGSAASSKLILSNKRR